MTEDADFCYDFPRVILHRRSCPRYSGGVCHPLPTPVEPYSTAEEADAARTYAEFIDGLDEDIGGHDLAVAGAAKIGGTVLSRVPGRTGAPVGVVPDPCVQELLNLGYDYDEALRICADPTYGGVIYVDVVPVAREKGRSN